MPIIGPTAREHGVDDDMLHLLWNPVEISYHDDGLTMITGADPAGNPLAVGIAQDEDGQVVIIHAMRRETAGER